MPDYAQSWDQPFVERAHALPGNLDFVIDVPPGGAINMKYLTLAANTAVAAGATFTIGDTAGASEHFLWTGPAVPANQVTNMQRDDNAIVNDKLSEIKGGATGRQLFARLSGGGGNVNFYAGIGVR